MRPNRWNLVALVAGLLAVAAGGPWLASQVRSLPGAGHLAARADQRVATLEAHGLTGPGDARAVREALLATAGVTAAEVRPQQHRAYVVCAKSLPDSALVGAVRRAGFAAAAVPK